MGKCNRAISSCIIFLIKGYQSISHALLGQCCRFQPSCSAYAIEAIRIYGGVYGCYLALRRIVRCHPWCAGGMDPVPVSGKNQHVNDDD